MNNYFNDNNYDDDNGDDDEEEEDIGDDDYDDDDGSNEDEEEHECTYEARVKHGFYQKQPVLADFMCVHTGRCETLVTYVVCILSSLFDVCHTSFFGSTE